MTHSTTEGRGEERLLDFLLRYKFQFFLSSLAGIIYNTAVVLGPIFLGRLIDAAAAGSGDAIRLAALYFVAVTVFFQLARFIKRWYMRDQFNHVACDLRQTLLDRVMERDLPALERESVGDLMTRTVDDITLVVDTLMTTINEGWDTWLLMLSYFCVLLYMDWKVTLLASLFVPGTLFVAGIMKNRLYQYSLQTRQAASRAQARLQRYLAAISVLRLFGREEAEAAAIINAYEDQLHWEIKQAAGKYILLPAYALVAGIGVVIVIGLGGENVRSGVWTIGAFNAYMVMFIAFSGRTRVAAKVFNGWPAAKASWQRVREKMAAATASGAVAAPRAPAPTAMALEVSQLHFAYDRKEVLHHISFTAKLGEIIGITGAVGSGKTALLHALLGQYPYRGDIFLQGRPLRDLSAAQRKDMIAYAGHEQFLFAMTIADNILLGEGRDEEALAAALHLTALSGDLAQFEQGLATEVGETGRRLSGGQRQRLAMARAVYKKPALLLLDDPFSALDIATEARIIQGLRQEFADQIVIIASHRLSAFEHFDTILVLESGAVLESGTHPQLMEQRGLYYEICQAQNFMKEERSHEAAALPAFPEPGHEGRL